MWLRDMATKIEDVLSKLQEVTTLLDLQKLVEDLRDIYDVDHAVYHAINNSGDMFAALTYDPTWEPHYREQQYVTSDPVVRNSLKQFQPLNWKRLDWSTKHARQMYAEAVDAGIGNQGYSIPIRGPNGQFALFTVNGTNTDDEWATFLKDYGRDMLLVSHYLHQKVMEIIDPDDLTDTKELSPRERDALMLLGAGRSRGQVADQLSISEHTLRVYIDTARHKLGALNTTHAVALAMKQGKIVF